MMSTKAPTPAVEPTREQRIEAILEELRPHIEQAIRHLVERGVDVPEAEEFGAIDLEFRDAGLDLANHIRQATVASRKKRGTWAAASPAPRVSMLPSSIPTKAADS